MGGEAVTPLTAEELREVAKRNDIAKSEFWNVMRKAGMSDDVARANFNKHGYPSIIQDIDRLLATD